VMNVVSVLLANTSTAGFVAAKTTSGKAKIAPIPMRR